MIHRTGIAPAGCQIVLPTGIAADLLTCWTALGCSPPRHALFVVNIDAAAPKHTAQLHVLLLMQGENIACRYRHSNAVPRSAKGKKHLVPGAGAKLSKAAPAPGQVQSCVAGILA